MPSKRLNVPPSGARQSTKEPPLSIAGVNPVRVPPSAAAVAIAAVINSPDFHPPQSTPLRAPLRSALANQSRPFISLRASLRSSLAKERPSQSAAASAPLRPCESASAACLLASAPRATIGGQLVGSLSLRLATLAYARCSCRSPFDGSRPVRARKFPRLCRLRVRCARSRVVGSRPRA